MIRVFKSGRHAHRTPLSYAALAPLFQADITLVDRPARADIYLFAHSLDVQDAPEDLVADWRARRRPVVILSEEPFWDTIWGRQPLARQIHVDTAFGTLPVIQLNHHTCNIFRFERIPYYLLTHHRFAAAYRWRFRRNAARSVADWRADFARREVDLTFMFERRPEPHHDVRWPGGGIIGLCAWRTELANACAGRSTGGVVERLGQSWQGGPVRQDLADWHMDKITRLDGRARAIGALENTHQPDYITEKFFDAFACGARPLYFAAPDHRVHDLGLPGAAWRNLYGLEPDAAAGLVMGDSRPGADFLDAWHLAQTRLAALFDDTGLMVRERERLKRAVVQELQVIAAAS